MAEVCVWFVVVYLRASCVLTVPVTGCDEIIFNPLIKWVTKGPISKQLRTFVWSSAPVHYKIGMMACRSFSISHKLHPLIIVFTSLQICSHIVSIRLHCHRTPGPDMFHFLQTVSLSLQPEVSSTTSSSDSLPTSTSFTYTVSRSSSPVSSSSPDSGMWASPSWSTVSVSVASSLRSWRI